MAECDGCAALTARVAALEAQAPPVEAYLDLQTVATALGLSRDGLHRYMQAHRAALSPPRYRFTRRSRYRMLPTRDVRTLEALVMRRYRRYDKQAA